MIKDFLRMSQKFALENSPTILTSIGVVGAISTAILTGRATSRAVRMIDSENTDNHPYKRPTTNREKMELVWKEYIPPAVVGAITLTAIIGANRVGARKAAAMAAAFKLSERMAEEYRAKVVEHLGDKKEEMVRSDVARERLGKVDGVQTIILSDDEIIFYDSWSDRAFPSTRERVESAVNQVNYQINQSWAVSLSEFYEALGMNKTAVSDDFGWNTDELLSIYYTSCLLPNGKPACEIRYNTQPFQRFNKIG